MLFAIEPPRLSVPEHDLMDGDAGEGEDTVLLRVLPRASDHGPIMTLEVLGENICVEENFAHVLGEEGRVN